MFQLEMSDLTGYLGVAQSSTLCHEVTVGLIEQMCELNVSWM